MITVIWYCPRPFRVHFFIGKVCFCQLKTYNNVRQWWQYTSQDCTVLLFLCWKSYRSYIICFLQKHQLIEVISISSALNQLTEVISIKSIPKSILQTYYVEYTDDQTAWHFPWIKWQHIQNITFSPDTYSQAILKPAFTGFSAMSLFSV